MILHPLPWLVHVLEVNSTQEARAGSWMGGITHSTSNYPFGFPNPHKVYKNFNFSQSLHMDGPQKTWWTGKGQPVSSTCVHKLLGSLGHHTQFPQFQTIKTIPPAINPTSPSYRNHDLIMKATKTKQKGHHPTMVAQSPSRLEDAMS